jgi:small subunit ribosomal protein S3
MGQKVMPTGFRVGIFEDWRSRWYAAGKKDFADLLVEDHQIREFVKKTYGKAGIPKVEIERTRDEVKVVLHAARPGILIGKKGAEADKIQDDLQAFTGRRINVKINEISRPEVNAQLVAEDIAEQLARRGSFRRAMKRGMEQVMEAGAKGVKMQLSGRLNGSEMARCEKGHLGAVPLTTLRAFIDYGFAEAKTAQGHIGIKVWINRGYYDTEEANAPDAQAGQVPQKSKRKNKR